MEEEFNKRLVEQYLKYGSVDEVYRANRDNLHISYAGFQRVLDRWGVVKAAGPNNKFSEIVGFMAHLIKDNIAIEELYRKMPPSFQTSTATIYRVLSYVKEGITRRIGTALVLTPYNSKEKILLGHDVSTPRIELGKPYGSLSLPMGYSSKEDDRKTKILRVLQQEVFTREVIDGNFPYSLIPENPLPFMYLDIADVRVAVFAIQLPKKFSQLKRFSSFKLKSYQYFSLDEMVRLDEKHNFRAGMKEAAVGYKKYLELINRNLVTNPLQMKSILNKELATVTLDIEDSQLV